VEGLADWGIRRKGAEPPRRKGMTDELSEDLRRGLCGLQTCVPQALAAMRRANGTLTQIHQSLHQTLTRIWTLYRQRQTITRPTNLTTAALNEE
jgi:hypothetical protein